MRARRRRGDGRREERDSLRSLVDKPELAQQPDQPSVLDLSGHLALEDVSVAAKEQVRACQPSLALGRVSFLNSLHRGVELVQHPRSEHAEHLVNPLGPGFAEEEHDEVLDLERVGPAQDLERLRQVLDR